MNKSLLNLSKVYLESVIYTNQKKNQSPDEKNKQDENDNIDDLTKENIVTIAEDNEKENEDGDKNKNAEEENDDKSSESTNSESNQENNKETNVSIEIQDEDVNDFSDDTMKNELDNNDLDDGWNDEINESLSDLFEKLDSFIYEIKNCKKGSFTDCHTISELAEYMKELGNELIEKADEFNSGDEENE